MRYATPYQLEILIRERDAECAWYVVCHTSGAAPEGYGPLDRGSAMRVRRLIAELNPGARTWLEREAEVDKPIAD